MLAENEFDDIKNDCGSLTLQRNWLLGIQITYFVISISVITYLIIRYKTKCKISKDIVMSNQATKFIKIVREVRGQETRCEIAKSKGYCSKKICFECNDKDENDEELPKTILIYIPKCVNLDETTERKLNLLAMSEDMRNLNSFDSVQRCKGKCLDESTNTSVISCTSSILPSKTKSDKDLG